MVAAAAVAAVLESVLATGAIDEEGAADIVAPLEEAPVVFGNDIEVTGSTGGALLAPKRARILLRAAATAELVLVDASEPVFITCG